MGKAAKRRSRRAGKAGRDADSPTDVPARGWRQVLARAARRSWRNNIALVAAGTAFYGLVAIVPIAIVCLILYSALGDPADMLRNVRRLEALMPPAAVDQIAAQFERIVNASARAKGFGVAGALAVALFGARNAATALIAALNIAYGETEKRGFSRLTAVALTLMAAGFALTFAILAMFSLIGGMSAALPDAGSLGGRLLQLLGALLVAALAATGSAALYRFAPCRAKPKWRWSAPGSLIAAGLWLVVTILFSAYARHWGTFAATYGPAAAPVVLLIWLYLSALAFLIGAEINAELERQTGRDTTEGADKPRGARGAEAADELA